MNVVSISISKNEFCKEIPKMSTIEESASSLMSPREVLYLPITFETFPSIICPLGLLNLLYLLINYLMVLDLFSNNLIKVHKSSEIS